MEQNQKRSLGERWEQLQPSKTVLAWACAGSVAATVALGFTLGGWVWGGTAQQMASNAADEARAELAAIICVERFLAADDVNAQLVELNDIGSTFRQRQFVETGGWATMPTMESANRRAADLCAQALVAYEMESAMSGEPASDEL